MDHYIKTYQIPPVNGIFRTEDNPFANNLSGTFLSTGHVLRNMYKSLYPVNRNTSKELLQIDYQYEPSSIKSIRHNHFATSLAIAPATVLIKQPYEDQLYDLGFGEWIVAEGYRQVTPETNAIELYSKYREHMDHLKLMILMYKKTSERCFHYANYYGNIYDGTNKVCWGELADKDKEDRDISAYFNSGFNMDLSSYIKGLVDNGVRIKGRKIRVSKDGKIEVLARGSDTKTDYEATIDQVLMPFSEYKMNDGLATMASDEFQIFGKLCTPFGEKMTENIIVHYLLTEYQKIPGITLTMNCHTTIY